MDRTRGYLLSIATAALAVFLATCGDDKAPECEKPADCVGRQAGNYCKVVEGKSRCVVECLPAADGTDSCRPTYKCIGKADDGSLFCKPV